MRHRTITGLAVAFALLAAPGARAGQTVSGAYQCTINVASGLHNCTNGIVTVLSSSGNQRTARIGLSNYVRLDALVDVCNPTGWWIHLGDSPTNNGGGGDAGDTDYDAEAYVLGTAFEMVGTFDTVRQVLDPIYKVENAVTASGCSQVQWTIYEDQLAFDDDGVTSDLPLAEIGTKNGFERNSGNDSYKWYAGINRTVGDAFRSGSGVTKVCFVLSTSTAPSTTTISNLCATGSI